MELKVGMKVYLEPGINTGRHNKDIREGEIIKIGRKYITVEIAKGGYGKYEFYKDNLRQKTDYCADYYLYFSKQKILDKKEIASLTSDLRGVFSHWNSDKLSLDQLRRIMNIVNEGNRE